MSNSFIPYIPLDDDEGQTTGLQIKRFSISISSSGGTITGILNPFLLFGAANTSGSDNETYIIAWSGGDIQQEAHSINTVTFSSSSERVTSRFAGTLDGIVLYGVAASY